MEVKLSHGLQENLRRMVFPSLFHLLPEMFEARFFRLLLAMYEAFTNNIVKNGKIVKHASGLTCILGDSLVLMQR
ncbi:hypothetical protein YC2023_052040 [Brassica napus]